MNEAYFALNQNVEKMKNLDRESREAEYKKTYKN